LQTEKNSFSHYYNLPGKKSGGGRGQDPHGPQALDQGPAQELTWSKKGKKTPLKIRLAIFGNQVFFENVPSSATSLLSSVTSDQEKPWKNQGRLALSGEKGNRALSHLQPSPSKPTRNQDKPTCTRSLFSLSFLDAHNSGETDCNSY
jgi:hypothetical protein